MKPSDPAGTIICTVAGGVQAPPAVVFERVRALDPALTFTGRGVVPAVEASEHVVGDWSTIGATRRLDFADAGTAVEELTAHERGDRYAYEVSAFTGGVRQLLAGMRCEWRFAETASGSTRIEWQVALRPRRYRTALVRVFFAPAWRRYMTDVLGRTIDRVSATPVPGYGSDATRE